MRDEWEIAREKGDSPAAKSAVIQTPAAIDGPKRSAPVLAVKENTASEVPEPTKRVSKKNAEPAPKKDFADVINSWSSDDDD